MEKITYTFADGKTVEIEVTEAFKIDYRKLDEEFKKNETKFRWRQRKKDASLEKLQAEKGLDLQDGAVSVDEQVLDTEFFAKFMTLLTEQQSLLLPAVKVLILRQNVRLILSNASRISRYSCAKEVRAERSRRRQRGANSYLFPMRTRQKSI